uniref:Uncharacterized protein n=1 Tax=Oryza meridionalis TaxID=40149 RepID=A0A0E0D4V4_9ORYZ
MIRTTASSGFHGDGATEAMRGRVRQRRSEWWWSWAKMESGDRGWQRTQQHTPTEKESKRRHEKAEKYAILLKHADDEDGRKIRLWMTH